ncbi:ankyrin repeat domain-containing protein 13C-like isoform X2 [Lineus longissimus]|uniref:ankyrin repeat domain-containing protein 13C-like isoform X2 n=1 Tax=Lineus longissimus TaxID=88925 RepID=UPI002B4CC737
MADEFPLHECVFKGDIRQLSQLLRSHDVTQKDKHGNTPLHLAVMLGHKECVHLLLAHGAPVKVKNAQGWNPLAEAISRGDRQTITSLLRKLKQQSREALEERRPALIKALKDLGDFYLELKWDFHSWVPLVSRILPSDICRIHKKGSSIRLDTTLVDFNDMRWEHGDITFIFNGESKPSNSLTVLDNKLKVFQNIRNEESESEIEDEIDILMSSDIVAAQMPTKNITFTRAQKGFLFREDKTEMVGEFKADFYAVHGMLLDTRKRREHLSDEDLQKNKALMESLSKGTIVENCDIQRRPSLLPPSTPKVSWEVYINSNESSPPNLGRNQRLKRTSKSFKATLAMSETFPMTVEVLMDVLEVIAPFKHFNKLRDFMLTRLPPGFPVKIEIPVFPTVTAKITFQVFKYDNNIPGHKFRIPRDYHEDPNRFPDL